ncbi:MAG: alpha/beta fold hydrolase [Cytophagaceae bacterium]
MKESSGYLDMEKASLYYSVRGSGSEVLLSFHGYGQSNKDFRVLDEVLHEKYTIYGFDLFFHGESFWHEKDKPLLKSFWKELLSGFLKEHNIERFSVMGFSMGGKFALASLESFPEKVDKLFLIAPDGIKISFWYRLATEYPFMRKIFRGLILKPWMYYGFMKKLQQFSLLNKKVLKFADSQLITREQRRRVYYSWVVFRKISFAIGDIALIINSHNIELEIFLGKYDKIITYNKVKKLLHKIRHPKLTILNEGHSNLIRAVAAHYKKLS